MAAFAAIILSFTATFAVLNRLAHHNILYRDRMTQAQANMVESLVTFS
jgi:hypothetical protein